MTYLGRALASLAAFALCVGAAKPDPANPSCPAEPGWGEAKTMTLTKRTLGGKTVLVADGIVDETLPERLREAIEADDQIGEIWLRSRGGDARAGNEAGKIIRSYTGLATRIPAGWTCFSACNFVFMGGMPRFVEPGGIFMVHMFTHTDQRDVVSMAVNDGTNQTIELIGEIEQSSALLASEDNDFLIRMGISRKLLTDVMYRQAATGGPDKHGTRYCLDQDEVRQYNVMPVG